MLHLPARGELRDRQFRDLPGLLQAGDLLVVNNTSVVPARLFGAKLSGARVEMLLERQLGGNRALAQLRANRSPAAGQELVFEGGATARVLGR